MRGRFFSRMGAHPAGGKIGQGDGLLLESDFLYYLENGSFWDVFKALLEMLLTP